MNKSKIQNKILGFNKILYKLNKIIKMNKKKNQSKILEVNKVLYKTKKLMIFKV